MKFVALLQVRTESHRLPAKAFLDVHGKSILDRCIDSLLSLRKIYDHVAVLTTINQMDDLIEQKCAEKKISVVRGSEINVIDRFHCAAENLGLDLTSWITRMTGDNPFIIEEQHSQVINFIRKNLISFNSPILASSRYTEQIKGLEFEVFNVRALSVARTHAVTQYDQEHVTPQMYSNPLVQKIDLSFSRTLDGVDKQGFTVDTLQDWYFANLIASNLEAVREKLKGEFSWKFL